MAGGELRDYYNEIDPYAAQWLRNLIAAGHLPDGDVDERDIRDIRPADLDSYRRCHFFAGIGVWALALEIAGWPADLPVWTGSCPCQPFSAAGAGAGFEDERHLWPDWHWLIEQCRPETVLGEQVASSDGLVWADLVSSDMEATGYAFGAVDTCAAGFRSFHIRQRLYFAAHDPRSAERAERLAETIRAHGGLGDTSRSRGAAWVSEEMGPGERDAEITDNGMRGFSGRDARRSEPYRLANAECVERNGGRAGQTLHKPEQIERAERLRDVERLDNPTGARHQPEGKGTESEARNETRLRGLERRRTPDRLADSDGWNPSPEWEQRRREQRLFSGRCGCGDGLADAGSERLRRGSGPGDGAPEPAEGEARQWERSRSDDRSGRSDVWADPSDGYWRDADWLFCRDGVWRPVEPGTFPLVDAAPSRMGRLRAYGNGLDLAQATGFVRAYLEKDQGAGQAADLFEWGA